MKALLHLTVITAAALTLYFVPSEHQIVIAVGVFCAGQILVWLITRPPDKTKDWRRETDLELTVDFKRGSLNGVSLGSRAERLSFLGPAEDRSAARDGCLQYFSLGLCVELERDGTIMSYMIVHRDPYEERYSPFPGSALHGEQTLDVSELTEDLAVGQLGEPASREEDDEEIILYYKKGDFQCEFEFDTESRFKCVVLHQFSE